MDRVARLRGRTIEKQVGACGMPANEPGTLKSGFGPGEVFPPNQNIDVPRISDCGFVDTGHPERDGVAANDSVGDAGGPKRRGCPEQTLTNPLHSGYHPFQREWPDRCHDSVILAYFRRADGVPAASSEYTRPARFASAA